MQAIGLRATSRDIRPGPAPVADPFQSSLGRLGDQPPRTEEANRPLGHELAGDRICMW